MGGCAGQTDVNATGATIKISNNFYSDNIAGANTINLNNAFATLADGSTDSLSGTGYVAASYGTVNLSGSANLKFSGNNEAVNNSNGTDTLEMSGLDNKVVGSGATITQDALSSLSVIGSNNIYDPYSDVALWAVGSSINLNNNSLTDINLFGNGNSLFGNGAYDTFNIFATTSYDYLNYSTASYIGASTYDYSYGAGTTSFTNTTPDYSYFDFAVSFDDPVVLNLVGTKVQTQNLVSSTAYFDMQNNGTKVHTGWGTAGEGYLVYDPANKNTVTDDQSLVASFAAMKALDQNGDGMLSALDKSWASMKVWVDAAGNGAFVAGSLKTMDQIGIASINLNAAHVNTNQNNNTILDDSTFTWKTGATGDIAGVDFNFHAASVVTPVVHTGGGGGGCVQYASLLPDGRTAGEMVIGSEMVLAHEQTLEAGTGVVRFSQRRTFPGFRITTESGITLVCSETAPIPTPNGLVRPPELLGLHVAVRRDEGGSFMTGWEKVTRVDPVGAIDVQQIDVGDRCFWAGEHANAFILHHNIGAYKMIP